MNDYQMRFMADDHQGQLRAEADRARLARQSRRADRAPVAPSVVAGRRRRPGRLSLRSLLARFAV